MHPNKDTKLKLLFNIREVCQATSMGRSTIYEFIKAGRLKAVKAGRSTLVRAEALNSFIETLPEVA